MMLPETGQADAGTPAAGIVARGLVKVYAGRVRALDGFDLDVEPGSVLALLGPNGAGKTTVVRILATILRPDAGDALVGGHDPVENAPAVRRLIGLAGQNAAVDEMLTGRENLRLAGRLAHMAPPAVTARTSELLERFDLVDVADRPVNTYSGGMRRRLDLAAALVHHPPILFLDEPTTGLDPRSRGHVWTMIRELVGAGTTVLLTTQYLEEADELADRIVVMDTGRAVANGTAAQLKAGLPATIELEVTNNREASKAALVLTPLTGEEPQIDGRRIDFSVSDGRQQLLHALRLLDREGLQLSGAALREPSLDDVFFNLTGRSTTDQPAPGRRDPPAPTRRPANYRRRTTATLTAATRTAAPPQHSRIGWTIRDSSELTRRMLLHFARVPYTLVFTAMQPIIFALLFRYVFSGAFEGFPAAGDYVDFLMPGILAMAVGFGAITTAIGIASDMETGAIDRFRSLPMARSAVLIGHTTADFLRSALVIVLIVAMGFLIGFDIHTNWPAFLAGVGLILAFSYALIWVSAIVGVISPSAQTAEGMIFTVLFPLSFASSAFVPTDSMPGWVQAFTDHQPFSAAIDASRALMLGGPTTAPVLTALAWTAGSLVVLVPLATWRYRRIE
jgi:ABC-2 type transport system ATP-binding protein